MTREEDVRADVPREEEVQAALRRCLDVAGDSGELVSRLAGEPLAETAAFVRRLHDLLQGAGPDAGAAATVVRLIDRRRSAMAALGIEHSFGEHVPDGVLDGWDALVDADGLAAAAAAVVEFSMTAQEEFDSFAQVLVADALARQDEVNAVRYHARWELLRECRAIGVPATLARRSIPGLTDALHAMTAYVAATPPPPPTVPPPPVVAPAPMEEVLPPVVRALLQGAAALAHALPERDATPLDGASLDAAVELARWAREATPDLAPYAPLLRGFHATLLLVRHRRTGDRNDLELAADGLLAAVDESAWIDPYAPVLVAAANVCLARLWRSDATHDRRRLDALIGCQRAAGTFATGEAEAELSWWAGRMRELARSGTGSVTAANVARLERARTALSTRAGPGGELPIPLLPGLPPLPG
ncbi:hypothetical protein [Nonomuraea sp. NPDC049607]|uniref:hypothetical protein n=1 Tax=Nonomuraea sp. NPDC049607 TaxID=3154732 RepID=UPI00342AF5B8